MKSRQVPGHVLINNGISPPGSSSYHNMRVHHGHQQRLHNYHLLPMKIISKQHHHQQQHHYQRYYYSNNPSKLNTGISSSSPSCYLCNKSFPSPRLLYGHMMRLHPERGMKGVLPREQARVPSQSQSLNERGMSQSPRAPIIPLKKSVIPFHSVSSPASELSDVTEPDCDPVNAVLSWGKKDRRGRTNDPSSCACNAAIASLQKRPNDETMEATRKSIVIPSSTRNTPLANQQNPKRSGSARLIDNKMMKMTTMSKKHKCNTCHKEFDTGQALGGHKSSSSCRAARETKLVSPPDHNLAPQVIVSTTTKKTIDDDDIEEGEIIEDGGITDEEGTHRISHKMFDFDLNELPPEE